MIYFHFVSKTFLVFGMISQVDSLGFTFLSSSLIFWVYYVSFSKEEFFLKKFTLTFQNFVFSVSGSVSPVDSSSSVRANTSMSVNSNRSIFPSSAFIVSDFRRLYGYSPG